MNILAQNKCKVNEVAIQWGVKNVQNKGRTKRYSRLLYKKQVRFD